MAVLQAEIRERTEVVCSARGRTQTNSRKATDDGPAGFSSGELMMISLGNCALGTLIGHPLLAHHEIERAAVEFEPEYASDPTRIARITARFELVVDDPALLEHRDTLIEVASTCPMSNTLSAVDIRIELNLRLSEDAG